MTSEVMGHRLASLSRLAGMTLVVDAVDVGALLRTWRERRRFSQLELSNRSRVSTRHLSRVETGKARPTPEMVLHLADHLDVPLRERNRLLLAAGYAPHYQDHRLDDRLRRGGDGRSAAPARRASAVPGAAAGHVLGRHRRERRGRPRCWSAATRRCSSRR